MSEILRIEEETYKKYLSALISGEKKTCEAIVNSLLDGQIDIRTL